MVKSAPADAHGGVRLDDAPHRDRGRWVCAACGAHVADADAVVGLPGRDPIASHVNPAGIVFQVMTLGDAVVRVSGPMVPAFTWFPGYVWRLATCFGCHGHLGWRYVRAVGDGDPPAFYGLIVDRLRRV